MSGDVVNLNRFRKQRARIGKKAQAEENRRRHGRSKAERHADEHRTRQHARHVEEHRLDDDGGDTDR